MFGVIMTLFYLGVGLYLLLSQNLTYVDKFLRILVGSTFIFYGIYRAYRTFVKIKELFFSGDDDAERGF